MRENYYYTMGNSPRPSKTPTTAAHPSAAAVEESPVYSYLSNLSPIESMNPTPVAQTFPGLNSPPLVFTNPKEKISNKEQAELEFSSHLKPVEANSSQRYQDFEPVTFTNHPLHNQHQVNSITNELSATQDISAMEYETILSELKNKPPDPIFKANQNPSGVRRRCLQFEDTQKQKTINSSELEIFVASSLNVPTIHTRKLAIPSGIGLHLNSIINIEEKQSSHFTFHGKRSISNESILTPPPHNVKHIEKQSSEKRSYDNAFNNEESEKKRKKIEEGCKRCNCKKTKCLKLYCDCFAANTYCSGDCTCQGCLNKPEYEDKVNETRKQIESRNPFAFTPKIIQNATNPIVETVNHFTPASSRHKRGCNCKKSMCLKKYCECYQANVGCSDGCRCEGCQNAFGLKEDYGKVKPLVPDDDLSNTQNLTPITPSLEHGKPWFASGRFIQTPDLEYGEDGSRIIGHYHPLMGPHDWASQSGISLNWRKSPISNINYVSGNKLVDTFESDTPEILKESGVKVTSPNKKRVSPPHGNNIINSGVSINSGTGSSLRSGRKFILQSVPSFLPLSSCNESKNDENQSLNGTERK